MFDNKLYLEDIENIIQSIDDWNFIKNKSVFISGASGMIGSLIVDVLMDVNYKFNCNCTIIANGRNEELMKSKFERYLNDANFKLYIQDINNPLNIDEDINFIIHAASNTHPMAYSQDPIGTITTNIIGTNNLLNCAVNKKTEKIIFLSSVEIYGENKGDIDKFEENYLGYINCNTLRAGYPESKRAGEALCQAYIEKYNMDLVIVTIDNNNKINSKEYAKDFYDYNYFGTNDTYDGILYLIDMDNREVYILTTGKAMLFYDDFRINSLLDKASASLSLGYYYNSVNTFIIEASNYVELGIPESNNGYEIDSNGNLVKIKNVNWVITCIGSLLIPSIILYFLISRHKGIKLTTTADTYLDENSINYGEFKDTYLTSYTSRVPIVRSDSSGRNRGSGSSISIGSSGRSHGGGGRKF